MTTASKPQTSLADIRREIAALRSFIIGLAGRDPEGAYKPEFVARVLKTVRGKDRGTFRTPGDLLRRLR